MKSLLVALMAFACLAVAHAIPAEWNGIAFNFATQAEMNNFSKDPVGSLTRAGAKPIGKFLFDPISGIRIKPEAAKGSSVFRGVTYYFAHPRNKKAFDASPAKFATLPTKRNLYCAVCGEFIDKPSMAYSYCDYNGVRYYLKYTTCDGPFRSDKARYSGVSAPYTRAPKMIQGAIGFYTASNGVAPCCRGAIAVAP